MEMDMNQNQNHCPCGSGHEHVAGVCDRCAPAYLDIWESEEETERTMKHRCSVASYRMSDLDLEAGRFGRMPSTNDPMDEIRMWIAPWLAFAKGGAEETREPEDRRRKFRTERPSCPYHFVRVPRGAR
jgi:hypothetical protein